MTPSALVLAGGLGTRLRAAVPDRPKVLAPIRGVPFVDILLAALRERGVRRVVLLVGAMHEQVEAHVHDNLPAELRDLDIAFSLETTPLGTAGAVKNAARFCDQPFLLVNGDTYFTFDLPSLVAGHERLGTLVTLAACPIDDTSRYGSLDLDDAGRVRAFREKATSAGSGVINGGIYLMDPGVLDEIPGGRAVSLETEVFPKLVAAAPSRIGAVVQHGDFFDIGTEASYRAFGEFAARLRPHTTGAVP